MSGNANRAPVQERRLRALELRRSGMNYLQIGAVLHVSGPQAFRDVQYMLRLTAQEPADHVRRLELERLDAMLLAHWDNAAGGSIPHTMTVLRIMERRHALLGLDAPKKIDLTAYIRDMAEREGIDPDAAVAEAQEIVRTVKW